MGFFECCHFCKLRFPGCHDVCPDYKDAKKLWDELREAERKAKLSEPPLTAAQKAAWHAHAKRR